MPAPDGVQASGAWEIDVERRELRTGGRAVPIGGRAFELLEVLVAAHNELVTKERLMARVWPGAIVEENTLQVHVSAIRKALGLDRGLLQVVSGRGYRLLGRWTVRQNGVPPAPLLPSGVAETRPTAGRLPLAASELIGRSEAVQHVAVLLSAYRVVTLAGPGGIGKTSLALEVGRRSATEFEDGAHFVEFAAMAEPGLLPSAVAKVLGLALGANQASAMTVADAIGERAMLLVVDNCEHVITAAATIAEALIRTCPNLAILATSREPLRIDGEYVYRVPPLSLPPEGVEERSELLRHGAVRLFLARTRSQGFDFCAEGTDLGAVAAICRRLDGIPLAIEFAAARAATVGPEHVLSRLEDRFAHLTVGRRTALPRHQTLRAALDWSYDLLPEAEQCLLRRLAIFAGSFTLDAAAAVMKGTDGDSVAESLSALVAKSLVSVEGAQPTTRWLLLETIRAYALDKLSLAGETQETARRHAEHYRNLVEQRPTAAGALVVCGSEIGNVRAALDWCFSDAGDPAIGVALTAAYAPVWLHLAVLPECRKAIERALARCGPEIEARILMRLNIALGLVQSYTQAPYLRSIEELLSEALAIAERLDDVESRILALWGLSTLRMRDGDHRAAGSLAASIATAAERSGDVADIAVGNRALGTSRYYAGSQSAARRHLERVVALPVTAIREDYEALLLTDLRLQSRAMLARVLLVQGCFDRARAQALTSYELALAANHRMSICFTLRYAVCGASLTLGDLPGAEAAVAKLIETAAAFKFSPWARQGRCLDAMLMIRRGDHANGPERLKAAIDANMNGGFSLCYPEMLGTLAEGFMFQGQHDEAMSTLNTAVEWSEQTGEMWFLPELFRLEGELALQTPVAEVTKAEIAFLRAVRLARKQSALLWELRAASSLARLRLKQEQHAKAKRILGPVLARVTEGSDTIDVRNAHALLVTLA